MPGNPGHRHSYSCGKNPPCPPLRKGGKGMAVQAVRVTAWIFSPPFEGGVGGVLMTAFLNRSLPAGSPLGHAPCYSVRN